MKPVIVLALYFACAFSVLAADQPDPDAFRVLPPPNKEEAPEITPYLKYQTEMAWQQDEERRQSWASIKTEQDLEQIQRTMEKNLLNMLGGLPREKTALNPQITGIIREDGFRIEKLIFESLPGIYVTALVYVPEDGNKVHPGILVPAGHSTNGKNHYQGLCQRLVQRGYVVISWDPVGQGERSQFWDAKAAKSRYNLICAEHAVMGNLAFLAGTNLARWEIWDGIRAVDYLLTRPDVDPERINITGTSGGGTQTAYIAALDKRIKVAAPSCFITALPMRVYNRIFKDPDSDPEQDLYGMISEHIDHAGLLLMMYPRPVFVSAAVLDFFPIEGTHRTVREIRDLYTQFHHADRISMAEGYHGHDYSPQNQEAAIAFLDHFNGLPLRRGFPPLKQFDDKTLQCTRTGQVMLDFPKARSVMDSIREYYLEHKSQPSATLKQLYYSESRPQIESWSMGEFQGAVPVEGEIRWESRGSSQFHGVTIDKFLIHHSRYLQMPLLYFHKNGVDHRPILFWCGDHEKATADDWSAIVQHLDAGYDVVSVDPRGLGETRMNFKAVSPDDPALAHMTFDQAYASTISGVLADYVYNSVLTGRPYLFQMIEDVEIAQRFVTAKINSSVQFAVSGTGNGYTLASAVAESLSNVKLVPQSGARTIRWSEIVDQKTEVWPIEMLVPGGAYIH